MVYKVIRLFECFHETLKISAGSFECLNVKLWLFKEMQHPVQSPFPLLTHGAEHTLGWSSFLFGGCPAQAYRC